MVKLTTLFWDVGGVLLTNGWDTAARRRATERFKLDWDDFQRRHERIVTDFEEGRVSLDAYLDAVVFHRSRACTRDEFRRFIFSQSQEMEGLRIVEELAGRYLLATLNNESREINLYRIKHFNLRNYFSAFFSSCFLGVSKPQKKIYRAALDIVQRTAEACLFVDDRAENLETAHRLGMRTIHFKTPAQLRQELQSLGVEPCTAE